LTGLITACSGNAESVFPPGLSPLGELRVAASTDADFPENLELAAGIDTDIWVHARGYLRAPVKAIWKALQDERVFVDRRAVSEYTVEWDTEPEYDVSFLVSQSVEDIITVSYDEAWRQGFVHGTLEEPETVAIRFQKVAGTELIRRMEGSILLLTVTEEVSEFQFQEHMDTPMPDTEDLENYVTDMYGEIVAWVHGQELPEYP
jgi:hypothetical protein